MLGLLLLSERQADILGTDSNANPGADGRFSVGDSNLATAQTPHMSGGSVDRDGQRFPQHLRKASSSCAKGKSVRVNISFTAPSARNSSGIHQDDLVG